MLTVEWKFELYTPRAETANGCSQFFCPEMDKRLCRIQYFICVFGLRF